MVLDLSYNLIDTLDASFWNQTKATLRQLYVQHNMLNATLSSEWCAERAEQLLHICLPSCTID